MTQKTCPICKTAVSDPANRPFCSKRCADVDLQRWFSGRYVVAADAPEDDEGDAAPAAIPPDED
jgi:endogenous inhibitor of DNA gyrase (YacG/DUF329 family)